MPEETIRATVEDIDAIGERLPTGEIAAPQGAPSRARGWLVAVLVAVVWIAVATPLQLLRYVGTPPWRALWAEDGAFFLTEALPDRWGTILRPHSGYLQVTARGMGSIAAGVPLPDAPYVFAIGGAAVAALVAVYIYFSSASVLTHWWARVLVAFLSVFASVTAAEVAANGLDLHWYLLFACFWALWSTRTSTRWLILDGFVVALASLSGPLTVLLAPLALRRAFIGPRSRRYVVPAIWLVTVTVQMIEAATAPKLTFTPFRAGDLLPTFAQRVSESVLVGDRFMYQAWLHGGWPVAYLCLGLVVAVCVFGVVAVPERRWFVVAASVGSVVIFCIELFQRGSVDMRPRIGLYSLFQSRYTVVPVLLLLTAIVAIADAAPGRALRRAGVFVVRAMTATILVITLLSFTPRGDTRDVAPDWAQSLQTFQAQCRADPSTTVLVPIAPEPPWAVVVPCRRLLSDLR